MPTHYHVLGTFVDIFKAIHKLNRRYATRFNRRYGRHGHVFDSPYKAIAVESERQLVALVRYIALNPPNAETWPYSSYPGLIGTRPPFAFVDPTPIFDAFDTAEKLRQFVDEGREVEDTNLVPPAAATKFGERPG